MSEIRRQILDLIARGEARVSAHGYDELTEDHILVRDVMKGVSEAVLVEDYPDYHKDLFSSGTRGAIPFT